MSYIKKQLKALENSADRQKTKIICRKIVIGGLLYADKIFTNLRKKGRSGIKPPKIKGKPVASFASIPYISLAEQPEREFAVSPNSVIPIQSMLMDLDKKTALKLEFIWQEVIKFYVRDLNVPDTLLLIDDLISDRHKRAEKFFLDQMMAMDKKERKKFFSPLFTAATKAINQGLEYQDKNQVNAWLERFLKQ